MTIKAESPNSENILVLLKDVQNRYGYITEADINRIAQETGESVSSVYGVATFYSFLGVKTNGRNVIRICRSLPCHLKEMEIIRDKLSEVLGISPGETTSDGKFTLELTNCIGACDIAPAMLINNDLYGNLKIDNLHKILAEYK
jgi:NADH:ubiquinone oxidoreductase subunit E